MNTYIRAAASFCDKNTLVKVCRVCRVWSEPESDGLGLGLPYRRRRKTMYHLKTFTKATSSAFLTAIVSSTILQTRMLLKREMRCARTTPTGL